MPHRQRTQKVERLQQQANGGEAVSRNTWLVIYGTGGGNITMKANNLAMLDRDTSFAKARATQREQSPTARPPRNARSWVAATTMQAV